MFSIKKTFKMLFALTFFFVLYFGTSPSFVLGELLREQEEASETSVLNERPRAIWEGASYEPDIPKKRPSFFRYFYRILAAPFVLLYQYPLNERTGIHDTYLEFVNKGTDRQWKQSEIEFKHAKSATSDDTTESQETENTSYEPKGS